MRNRKDKNKTCPQADYYIFFLLAQDAKILFSFWIMGEVLLFATSMHKWLAYKYGLPINLIFLFSLLTPFCEHAMSERIQQEYKRKITCESARELHKTLVANWLEMYAKWETKGSLLHRHFIAPLLKGQPQCSLLVHQISNNGHHFS